MAILIESKRSTFFRNLSALMLVSSAVLALAAPMPVAEVTPDHIATGLEERLPIQRSIGPFDVSVENLLVELEDDNRMIIRAASRVTGLGTSGVGLTQAEIKIHFENGKMHFTDMDLQEVLVSETVDLPGPGGLTYEGWDTLVGRAQMEALNASGMAAVKQGIIAGNLPLIQGKLDQWISENSIADFDDLGRKGFIMKSFVSDISVQEDVALVTMRLSNIISQGFLLGLTALFALAQLITRRQEVTSQKRSGPTKRK